MTVSIKDIDGLKGLITEEWTDWTEAVDITQEMINTFADVTKDHQWIHVDLEKANAGPFGGPIAHGFLTLSLVSYLSAQIGPKIDGVVGALNYGADRLRFLNPVPAGSQVHARSRVVDVTEKSSGVLLKQEVAVHVVGDDKPALLYESLGLLLG
ncbi:MAG: MaoC family dehydratase [Acidimicrobiia bacterium]|nr:MaoC family dehydratase [Acidimicrobiia bacterium]